MAQRLHTSPCLVNGEPREWLWAQDRGLSYGDGLFETLAVRGGRPLAWDRHLGRLYAGCARLGLAPPEPDRLGEEADALCAGQDLGVLKLVLTAGVGGRGYRRPRPPRPTRVLSLYAWPDLPACAWRDGVRARVCEMRLGRNRRLAGIKHLNRLEQVLARSEWNDPAIAEGLLLDDEGWVVEATSSNLFVVRGGRLITPDLDQAGVAGVVRATVLEAARGAGIAVSIRQLRLEEVHAADEAFLCNSLIGIWPLRELEGSRWAPGAVTRRLQEALRALGVLGVAPSD